MRICVYNIEGVAKFYGNEDLLGYFNQFDVVALSETFHTQEIALDENFELISHIKSRKQKGKKIFNLKGRPSGGIAVFAKHGTGLKGVALDINTENCAIACQLGDWAIVFVYNPPKYSEYTSDKWDSVLSETINELSDSFRENIIVCGDFNARCGQLNELNEWSEDKFENSSFGQVQAMQRKSKDKLVNAYGKKMVSFCKDNNLVILNGRTVGDPEGDYTFIGSQGVSVIDVALTFEPNLQFLDLKIGERNESSHQPLEISLWNKCDLENENILTSGPALMGKKIVKFKWREDKSEIVSKNFNDARNDIINIISGEGDDNVNDIVDSLYSLLHKVLEPLKVREKKQKQPKLLLSRSAKRARCALRKFRRGNCKKALQDYIELKSSYKNELKTKRKEIKREKEDELLGFYKNRDWKSLWGRIRGGTKKRVSPPQIAPHLWIDHFDKLFNVGSDGNIAETKETIKVGSVDELDYEITEHEIDNAIKNLTVKKASGWDGIGNDILKNIGVYIVPLLKRLFNVILNSGKYPEKWKLTIIIPIFKNKNSPKDVQNYRGIGLTTALQKIFQKIIKNRLNAWSEINHLFPLCQAGFRKGHSTINQIFILETIANRYKKRDQPLYCFFADFEKCFDSINRELLWNKLAKIGVSDKITDILRDMYKGAQFSVRLGPNRISETVESRTGVLQGEVTSPLLFNLFMSDLPEYIDGNQFHFPCMNNKQLKMLAFADDLICMATSAIGLQRQIHRLNKYCNENNLKVNEVKSKVMVFNGKKKDRNNALFYGKCKLETTARFKYLGFNFEPSLSHNSHVEMCLRRARIASQSVLNFIRNRNTLPLKLSLNLGQAMVQSTLASCLEISAWDKHAETNKIMSSFYKGVLGLPLGAPSKGVELILGRRSFESFALIKGFKFLRKLVNSTEGQILHDAFEEQKRQCKVEEEAKKWRGQAGSKSLCWLGKAKSKIKEIGLGNLWDLTPKQDGEEKLMLNIFKTRITDTDLQSQREAANNLKSLQHFKSINIERTGVVELFQTAKRGDRRKLAQLLLNCPGSLVRREQDLLVCNVCSSPIWSRNFFVHYYLDCDGKLEENRPPQMKKLDCKAYLSTEIKYRKMLPSSTKN